MAPDKVTRIINQMEYVLFPFQVRLHAYIFLTQHDTQQTKHVEHINRPPAQPTTWPAPVRRVLSTGRRRTRRRARPTNPMTGIPTPSIRLPIVWRVAPLWRRRRARRRPLQHIIIRSGQGLLLAVDAPPSQFYAVHHRSLPGFLWCACARQQREMWMICLMCIYKNVKIWKKWEDDSITSIANCCVAMPIETYQVEVGEPRIVGWLERRGLQLQAWKQVKASWLKLLQSPDCVRQQTKAEPAQRKERARPELRYTRAHLEHASI
jgi:hypothetical protein